MFRSNRSRWGKPNNRVTSRKVSGCHEGVWAGVHFAERTKGAPDAIIGWRLADCQTEKKGEDGKPVELGRGGMGITYKAFDVDLRSSVTLKVISERYLGDESARFVFCGEPARQPASVTRMLPRSSISVKAE